MSRIYSCQFIGGRSILNSQSEFSKATQTLLKEKVSPLLARLKNDTPLPPKRRRASAPLSLVKSNMRGDICRRDGCEEEG
jgi:hypothetical protein